MSLRDFLRTWRTPLPSPSQVPTEPRQFVTAWERELRKLEGFEPRKLTAQDQEAVFREVRNHYRATGVLEGLRSRLLKRTPWVVFSHPTDAPGELGADPKFTAQYLAWLGIVRTPSAAASLLRSFLDSYPASLETFETWREGLKRTLVKSPSQRLTQARARCNRFRLLDKDGATLFAQILLQEEMPPEDILVEAKLAGQNEGIGFLKASFGRVLGLLFNALSEKRCQEAMLKRVLALSVNPLGRRLRNCIAPKALAEAMLLPYADNRADVVFKDIVRDFLVERIGDPRIQEAVWIGVDDRAKDVMLRWLVEVNLKDFFNILSMTAPEMWQARRDFWTGYLKYIKRAWVILGGKGRHIARTHLNSKNVYGELYGAASDQSVFLMHIGDIIIAEWSHSGACHLWTADNANAPEFYKHVYEASSLRGKNSHSDENVSHIGSWIPRIRDMVAHHTGIK